MGNPGSVPSAHVANHFDEHSAARAAAPELAREHARVSLAYGVACDVDLGDRSLRVDLPRTAGGTGSGPHPGQLMRASLGACLLMGYRQWSQRLGVPLTGAQLELSCDYDPRGQLGLDGGAAIGWQRLRIQTTLFSDAPEADLRQLVETAHRYSPMLANLSTSIERKFELHIRRSNVARSV